MRKLLIAEGSEDIGIALKAALKKYYDIILCGDGEDVPDLLRLHKPEALLIDLSLPCLDGILVLQRSGDCLPTAIIGTYTWLTGYQYRCASELGVGHLLRKPYQAPAIRHHVDRMLRLAACDIPLPDPAQSMLMHLHRLGFTPSDGYRQLQIGIPLFLGDPSQRMGKELYANIVDIGGFDNTRQVEHSIRCAIKRAWLKRDEAIWREYFPSDEDGTVPCPSNSVFFSCICEKLLEEYPLLR